MSNYRNPGSVGAEYRSIGNGIDIMFSDFSWLDPETAFMALKEKPARMGTHKESVRPLKRGLNVGLLDHALKSHTDNQLKKYLFEHRRRLIEAMDEYKGDDPLQPWIECIKWVQGAFPPGVDCSGLVVFYEQCVCTFWHEALYKDDLRYLKVCIGG